MTKPKISREALDRKITQIIQTVSKNKKDFENKDKSMDELLSFKESIGKQLDKIETVDALANLESKSKLIQAFHNMDAEIEAEFEMIRSEPRQAFSSVMDKAVDDYLESIAKFRQQGGEYFNGSVAYRPRPNEKEALYRILDKLKEDGYPVKIISDAHKLSRSAMELNSYSKTHTSLNFVTSLEGVDAFEENAKAEAIPILRDNIHCKRLFLDFTGQLRKPEDKAFDPETENHGGHVENEYEANAFVMGKGPVWQDHNDHSPKAKKFLTMAIASEPSSVENKIFYMYSKNNGFTKITPLSLAENSENQAPSNSTALGV